MRIRYHLLAQALAATFVLTALSGCDLLAIPLMTAHVLGVDERANIQFQFPKDTKNVAVVVNLTNHRQVDVGHFDRDVATMLAPKIHEYLDGKPKIIRSAAVHKWLDEHPDWKTPYDIGRGTGADHVVFVELRRVSYYQKEGWTNMYAGRAECSVSIYRLGSEADEAGPIWTKNYTYRFPTGLTEIASSDLSV